MRFYCEACEQCVCVACTYTEHRDHDLVDFKEGISHHKDKIEENLRRCRFKISELRNRCDILRQCETRMLYAQNEIHSVALQFIESIRQREKSLIEELDEYYGPECTEYLKKKDDLETFLEQLKSTCNLTEMVVKGKDIEMLLLKKQLCDKFTEFEQIDMDPVPRGLTKKVIFVPGSADLGKLTDPDVEDNLGVSKVSAKASSSDSDDKPFYNAHEDEDELDSKDTDDDSMLFWLLYYWQTKDFGLFGYLIKFNL